MYSAEAVEELIQCGICLEVYTNPKVLPCQHTFCFNCLVSHGSNEPSFSPHRTVDCPTCRKRQPLPQQGFCDLPDALLAKHLMELKIVQQKSLAKCARCPRVSNLKRCDHCAKQLCEECIVDHREFMINCINTTLALMRSHLTGPEVSKSLRLNKERLVAMGTGLAKEKKEMIELFERFSTALESRRNDFVDYFNRLEKVRKIAVNSCGVPNYDDVLLADTRHRLSAQISDAELKILKADVYKDLQWLQLLTDTVSKGNGFKFNLATTEGGSRSAGEPMRVEEMLRSLGELRAGITRVALDKYRDKSLEEIDEGTDDWNNNKRRHRDPSPVVCRVGYAYCVPSVFVRDSSSLSPSPTRASREPVFPRSPSPMRSVSPPLPRAGAHYLSKDNQSWGWRNILGNRGETRLIAPTGAALRNNGDSVVVTSNNDGGLMLVKLNGDWTRPLDSEALSFPSDVAVCMSGHNIISDRQNDRLVCTDDQGDVSYTTGSNGSGKGDFQLLDGVAVHNDMILAVDMILKRVTMFRLGDGGYVRHFGARHLFRPRFVAVGPHDLIYVTDDEADDVRVFSWQGQFLRSFGDRPNAGASGIVVDGDGFTCVARPDCGLVDVYKPNGDPHCTFGRPGRGAGCLQEPHGLELLPDGKVLVCDTGNDRLLIF